MKKLFVAVLGLWVVLLACIGVRASDISAGGSSFVDGQKLTAAQLNALVGQATILPSFFTGQVAAPSNLQSSDLILTVNNSGQFRKMAGSQVISAPAFFTNSAISTNFQPYSFVIYWNPSNSTVFQIAGSNLGFAISSNIVPTNIPFSTAGVNQLLPYTNIPAASNTTFQMLLPVYDTNNGVLFSLSFTNFVAAEASQLGSNNLIPWIYSNVFVPQIVVKSNATTNFWQFFQNFPVTNLTMTNTNGVVITNRTLVGTDAFPVNSGPQGTNTTVTLDTIQQYIQTNNPAIQGRFTSALFALPAVNNVVTNVPHGLGTTPHFVRWVLVNQTNEFGYTNGDEVDISGFDGNQGHGFTGGADATNVFLMINANSGASVELSRRDTGAYQSITLNRWKARCYAAP